MKADIVITELAVDNARKKVLPGVLLHIGEAALPVDRPGDRIALGKGRLLSEDMVYISVLDLHIGDSDASQGSPVRALASLLREERGPIEHHVRPLRREDLRGK